MPRQTFRLSAKVVIRNEKERVLLLKRSVASKNNAGKWDLPGGKVDEGEDFDEALLREVTEETGLVISLGRVLGAAESALPHCRVAYIVLEGHRVSGEVTLSSEHDAFVWADPSELGRMDVCEQFRHVLASCTRS
ncbi:MAG: NUDIX domain-containing protein [Planctomycetes bacterium]|nr:NUDIX domain-containing protein [Planctomycetota bacterium]